jgi:transcriptional regulator with XRE-family HTH domain
MRRELSEVITMSKPLSTYEKKMKDQKFKKAYKRSYKELLFSELLISVMEGDDKSVRELAKEAHLSPSVIQDIRSGKQHDIKVSNLIKIAQAFGYEVILQKGDERLALHEKTRGTKSHLSVTEAA